MTSVAEAYDANPERELGRLDRSAFHNLEFLVTMHQIEKHFPPKGRILDAGGGPGRYALELCRRGFEVVLLDISEGNIRLAEKNAASEPTEVRARMQYEVGDAADLSRFASRTFDAVLSAGPLTHIPLPADRTRTVNEVIRVARPGSPVILSACGYLAMLRTVMAGFSDQLLDDTRMDMMSQGDDICGGMQWHFFRAQELRELAEGCGLQTITMAGCQGLSTGLEQATNALAEVPEKWKRWMQLLMKTCEDSALVDMSGHILYIGHTPLAKDCTTGN